MRRGAFANLPIRVDPQSGLKLSLIAARARKHKQSLERQGKTLDAIIVDQHAHRLRRRIVMRGRLCERSRKTSGALKATCQRTSTSL